MSITLSIHKTHRQYTQGKAAVQVDGDTVGECLDAMITEFPGMQDALFAGNGKLKNQIEIYLNMESTYPDELKKKVQSGDEISIIVMLAGG
ncbi:MAG: MoaD/ThiS family protein [Deltaproteobacteria bacterium]|nr:MoaD/ThiS family protein [Deltaproteobacteria bacterium]